MALAHHATQLQKLQTKTYILNLINKANDKTPRSKKKKMPPGYKKMHYSKPNLQTSLKAHKIQFIDERKIEQNHLLNVILFLFREGKGT